tara:strand:- start:532 stop:945 length:414 start_codon:yes stop_codon:yes gene_type:complete
MAEQNEIELARLAVERRLVTQEQVLAALRLRNADPQGPDLGERLVQTGHLSSEVLDELRQAQARGEVPRPRHEASTDHMIPLGSTREVIARECLREAIEMLGTDRERALIELRRLTEDFMDTQSGVEASQRLAEENA